MTDASGLVYLRARYYNLATATFLSRDPFPGYAHLALSRNGYSYVHGNPVNYVDPSGELAWGVAAVAFLVGCGVGGIREALHQMSQDECGGGFFDKLKRVDWGPVAQACGEGGLFALTMLLPISAIFGYGGTIAATSLAGLVGYTVGTVIGNAVKGEPVFSSITLRSLEIAVWTSAVWGLANSGLATALSSSSLMAGYVPGTLSYMWATAPHYAFYGFVTAWFLDMAIDGKSDDMPGVLAGTLNMTSAFTVPYVGPALAIFAFAFSAAVSKEDAEESENMNNG